MYSTLRQLHSRRRLMAICFTIVALAAGPLAGSGCKSGDRLVAPDSAGTAEALSGTRWTEPESNVSYTFTNETDVDVVNPQLEAPMLGSFEVSEGVLTLSLGLRTLNGTWDGQTLVVEGKTLVRSE